MSGRFDRAVAAIDAANADDPHVLVVDGVARPKEQVHAELMTDWVRRLDPEASDAQLLAARAHHLRRWAVPRSSYPEGRAGYLRWRADQKRRHAEDVGGILRESGFDETTVAEVQRIIRKEGLGRDPVVQVHEDALCLVFLQTQLAEVAEQLGVDRTTEVLTKTLAKMSSAARARVDELGLAPEARALLDIAADRAR